MRSTESRDKFINTDLVDTGVREVAEDVAVVQTSHGDLRDNHLEESRERRENAIFAFFKTKTGCSGEVPPLHDTGGNEDHRVLLVDDLEAGGTLKIACVVPSAHDLSLQETHNTYCR